MEDNNLIGKRVLCDDTRGTIKWSGSIPGASGIWYGVDWDYNKKGKHNGSHKGVKYFDTRNSTSGSFIRKEKLNFGITIEEALQKRYQDDASIPESVSTELQRAINARFVEFVGMEKIGKKQSKLDSLKIVVLDGLPVSQGVPNIGQILPIVKDLDLSNSLICSWDEVARITRLLPTLKFLNLSGNHLQLPKQDITPDVEHITHLILNHMISYGWSEIVSSLSFFPDLIRAQLSHNKLKYLGPLPPTLLNNLEELDLGVNDISSWEEICQLGFLPKLNSLNINKCKVDQIRFPDVERGNKTPLFVNLKSLMVADNPLKGWDSVGELNKLNQLEELILSLEIADQPHFLEFTFARILSLKSLNRTRVAASEKKDFQIFYLRHFSNEYYSSGGSENCLEDTLNNDFLKKHPTYLQLMKELGPPIDERSYAQLKTQKIKDMKINLTFSFPENSSIEDFSKSILPSTRLSKLKMTIKRSTKLCPSINLELSYTYEKDGESHEIPMDNDLNDLSYYSVENNNTIIVREK